jgi:uncharacterized protein
MNATEFLILNRNFASVTGSHLTEKETVMEVRCDLARIIITETSEQQYIVLRERDGERAFMIVIGPYEAAAIDRRLKGHPVPRPQAHDLLAGVIEQMGGELEKIVINDLRNGIFFARIVIRHGGQLIEVDSRPSDAIAVGIAGDVAIFVEEHVLDEASKQ